MTTVRAKLLAQQKWDSPPHWVLTLADAVDHEGQNAVAKMIGYSASVVHHVLRANYKGDLAKVEAAVRGALLGETVSCPVQEEITRARCLSNQKLPLLPTNTERVRLYRACRGGCRHSMIGGSHVHRR